MKLNEKGQCPACLKKPMVYKRPAHHLFCVRCDREYSPTTGEQMPNWAWFQLKNPELGDDGWRQHYGEPIAR